MKAKLIKKKDGWYNLYQDNIGIGSTHSELQGYKLSLKNCQAIERGYDLDELFQKELDELLFTGNLDDESDCKLYKSGMYKGARIIFELLGDKIFTLDDIYTVFIMGREGMEDKMNMYVTRIHEPTEWDVEIVMETVDLAFYENGNKYPIDANLPDRFKYKSKLDSNGCLILKRI